jgi:hypothetical protein
MKNKYRKENFDCILQIFIEKVIRFRKFFIIPLQHFSIGFDLVAFFPMFRQVPGTCPI